MERIWVDSKAQALCQSLGLKSREDLLRLMNLPEGGKTVVVQRNLTTSEGGLLRVFCKRYRYRPPAWRFVLRDSKARREFANYALFEALGIPCPRRILCLEQRDFFGRLSEAYILTEAVPHSLTLEEWMRRWRTQSPPGPGNWHTRRNLCGQLARMTRALHAGGGFHNDLYWRNILVSEASSAHPTLWWIDCPRGGRSWLPFRHHHRIVKDLAALNGDSIGLCGPAERVRFLQTYLGVKSLDEKGRGLLREVERYGRARWVARRAPPQAAAGKSPV